MISPTAAPLLDVRFQLIFFSVKIGKRNFKNILFYSTNWQSPMAVENVPKFVIMMANNLSSNCTPKQDFEIHFASLPTAALFSSMKLEFLENNCKIFFYVKINFKNFSSITFQVCVCFWWKRSLYLKPYLSLPYLSLKL